MLQGLSVAPLSLLQHHHMQQQQCQWWWSLLLCCARQAQPPAAGGQLLPVCWAMPLQCLLHHLVLLVLLP
jgi:hypothetical protein